MLIAGAKQVFQKMFSFFTLGSAHGLWGGLHPNFQTVYFPLTHVYFLKRISLQNLDASSSSPPLLLHPPHFLFFEDEAFNLFESNFVF